MSLVRRLRSKLLTLIFDSRLINARRGLVEARRRLSGKRHVVSVFLQIDDPYRTETRGDLGYKLREPKPDERPADRSF